MFGKVIHFDSLLVKLQLLENLKEILIESWTMDVALRQRGIGVPAMPLTPSGSLQSAEKSQQVSNHCLVTIVSFIPAKEERK